MLPVLHPSFYAAYCHDVEADWQTRNSKKEGGRTAGMGGSIGGSGIERSRRRVLLLLTLLAAFVVGLAEVLCLAGTDGNEGLLELLGLDNYIYPMLLDANLLPHDRHVCFVTAQYGSTKADADRLVDLRKEAPRLVPQQEHDGDDGDDGGNHGHNNGNPKKKPLSRSRRRRRWGRGGGGSSSEYAEKRKSYFHFFAFTNRRDLISNNNNNNDDEGDGDGDGGGTHDNDTAAAAADNHGGTTGNNNNNNDDDDVVVVVNGWTVIVQEFPQLSRFITQSRWPKFQGYKHPKLSSLCEVIFYMDGTVLPIGSPSRFQTEARRILHSDVQLAQEIHPLSKEGGIEGEMERCRIKGKDVDENLQASLEWLQSQPDYINDCVMYQNTFFGYANPNYVGGDGGRGVGDIDSGSTGLLSQQEQQQQQQQQQQLQQQQRLQQQQTPATSSSSSSSFSSQIRPPQQRPPQSQQQRPSQSPSPFGTAADFLWARFSLEEDSWRDQPLWCYALHHHSVKPLSISGGLFRYQGNRRPSHNHTYGKEADTAGKAYYEEQQRKQRQGHGQQGQQGQQGQGQEGG